MQHPLRNLFYFNQTASAIPGSIHLRPDKSLLSNIAEDLRKIGVTWIGGALIGYLLQSNGLALILFLIGATIWVAGLAVAAKANALDKEDT